MSCPASTVTFGELTLDLDPSSYNPFGGRRRGSVHFEVDGSTLIQDRGYTRAGDGTISFQGKIVNQATLDSLQTMYETGGIFTFADYFGSSYQVVFEPGQESFKATHIQGTPNAYDYQINLRITAVNTQA